MAQPRSEPLAMSPVCATDRHIGCLDESCRCFHHFSRHRNDHRSATVDGAAFAERFHDDGRHGADDERPDWSEVAA